VTGPAEARPALPSSLRIRFVDQLPSGETALLSFADPTPSCAILLKDSPTSADPNSDALLHITLLPLTAISQPSAPTPSAPLTCIKYRGVELTWRPGHATLQCDPDQADLLLPALVEFAHYERVLRRIEAEIASAWPEIEQDKRLAFEVTPADLKRTTIVGGRVNRAFQQRIRFARIEPHLYQPDASSPSAAQKLGEELRDKTRIESRLETVDAQIEVFEHIYEMASQRIGESRAAHDEHFLEWIIIILLAFEALLLFIPMLWRLRP
jgi:hypothetical protein